MNIIATAIGVWKASIDGIDRWSEQPCPHCGEVIISSKGLLRSIFEESYMNVLGLFKDGSTNPSNSLAENEGIKADMQDNQLVCSYCENPIKFNTLYEPQKD